MCAGVNQCTDYRHVSMRVCGQRWYGCTDMELFMWAGILLESSVCCEEVGGTWVCMPLFIYVYKTVLGLSGCTGLHSCVGPTCV